MAISPFSLSPDKLRSRLFWPTVCTIIATVASGVLVFYFTHPKSDTTDEPNKPAEKLELNRYCFPIRNVFEVNYPSLIGGVQFQFITEEACGCSIGVTPPDPNDIPWLEVTRIVFGKLDAIMISVTAPNAKSDKPWADMMSQFLFKKEDMVKREILYQLTEKELNSEYYEIHFKFGVWFLKTEYYVVLKSEVRDGLSLRCLACISRDKWKKLRHELRRSIQGIKWSPEAAREAFLKVKKIKTSQNELGSDE